MSASVSGSRHAPGLVPSGATGGDDVVSIVLLAIARPLVYAVVALGAIVPSLAVGVRRLHDVDKSGWWLLIGFVPLAGAIVLLVFTVQEGTPGPNRYGDNPKGVAGGYGYGPA